MLALPLLRVLSESEWQLLKLPGKAQEFAATISGNDFERDADGILERLDEVTGYENASLVLDLLAHAHAREWAELHASVCLARRQP